MDLNEQMFSLLFKEPFFASISRRVNKIEYNSIPTMGVTINKDTYNFELLYNPKFVERLTRKQVRGVLKHEFYHIVLGHLTERKPINDEESMLWNIAYDLAINSFLEPSELPKGCCKPGNKPFEKYPNKLSSEQYYTLIQKESKEFKQMLQQMYGDSIQHIWDNLSDGEKEYIKEKIKQMNKKAIEECSGNFGTIPQEMKEEIMRRVCTPHVDWRNVLRYFIKKTIKAEKISTIRRINKRFPYIHPGTKSNRYAKIAVSVDQSGSISDELLVLFFSELEHLSDIATFTVIPFDTEVNSKNVFEWKKGKSWKWKRDHCGGTDFDAPTKYVNEHKFDGHIVLTDLQAPKPIPSRCQRIWMTTEDNYQHPYFSTDEQIYVIKK